MCGHGFIVLKEYEGMGREGFVVVGLQLEGCNNALCPKWRRRDCHVPIRPVPITYTLTLGEMYSMYS